MRRSAPHFTVNFFRFPWKALLNIAISVFSRLSRLGKPDELSHSRAVKNPARLIFDLVALLPTLNCGDDIVPLGHTALLRYRLIPNFLEPKSIPVSFSK